MNKYTHIIKDKSGREHKIEENGWNKTHAFITVNGYKEMRLKLHFRHERTWNDHIGNTPCGYYVIVPIKSYYNGAYHTEKKRVYLTLAG